MTLMVSDFVRRGILKVKQSNTPQQRIILNSIMSTAPPILQSKAQVPKLLD
jgi:hypothetical protein